MKPYKVASHLWNNILWKQAILIKINLISVGKTIEGEYQWISRQICKSVIDLS